MIAKANQTCGSHVKNKDCVAAFICCAAFAVLCGCAKAPPPPTPRPQVATAADHWAAVPKKFIEDYFQAQPFFAVQAGRHEFDGKMRDFSVAGIAAEIQRLHAAQADVQAIDPSALEASQAFERKYILSIISHDLFWLERARWPFKNPAWYLDEIDPDVYLSRNYAPLAQRMKGYIGYARSIPGIAVQIRSNLQPPLAKTYVEYAVNAFGGFADFYRKDVAAVFASVADENLQRDLRDANARAAQAMDELKAWFVMQRKTANDGFAIGGDLFAAMLADTELVNLPTAQIEAAGRADLERNTSAMRTLCASFAPEASLSGCAAKVQSDKPKGSVVDAARAQLVELKHFVIQHRVARIPSNEEALVALAPPYNRANFAFISVAGPYDKGVASTYNIAPPDPAWSAAEQAAYVPGRGLLLMTSAHEVWPGHFLQFLHTNANPSKLGALFVSYAFAEGWAHYCEDMMVEMGLGTGDPAVLIGQRIEALLRDVRLLSAIGLHTQGMSVKQSERMFVEQAFQDIGNARQQSARGTYDPAYLNYTLGKFMIKKLRADWVANKHLSIRADEKSSWREFHDQFLSFGGPPIPLVREQMMGMSGAPL